LLRTPSRTSAKRSASGCTRTWQCRSWASSAPGWRFTSTCQRLGVEPWAYLHDVLTRLPAMPTAQHGDLLLDHWRATRRAEAATPGAPATDSPSPATTPVS